MVEYVPVAAAADSVDDAMAVHIAVDIVAAVPDSETTDDSPANHSNDRPRIVTTRRIPFPSWVHRRRRYRCGWSFCCGGI